MLVTIINPIVITNGTWWNRFFPCQVRVSRLKKNCELRKKRGCTWTRTEKMSERMPERMSNRMSEYICHTKLQMVCQKLCQNSGSGWGSTRRKYSGFGEHRLSENSRKSALQSWPKNRLGRHWTKDLLWGVADLCHGHGRIWCFHLIVG